MDNKGYNTKSNKWEESIGKAVPVENPNVGKLKVSFFGPFYSGYNVIAIEDDYRYALVAGHDLDYLWILSRETTIPDDTKQRFLSKASFIGYQTEKLVWTKQ